MPIKSIILEQAVENILPYLDAKENEKSNWEDLSENTLLKELILCLLSSSVKFEIASQYIKKIDSLGLFSKWIIQIPNFTEIFEILNAPIIINNRKLKYRFPKLRSQQICSLIQEIYSNGSSLKSLLRNNNNPKDTRKKLVLKCNGIGNKQSSMFLRNINFTNELAILDTHLVEYLKQLDIIPSGQNLTTNKKYFHIEQCYFNYANSKSYNIEKLDFAIWSIMKVYKKKFN